MKKSIIFLFVWLMLLYLLALTKTELQDLRAHVGFVFASLFLAYIAFSFLFVKLLSVRVYSEGIEGMNYWGLRRRFFWNQIRGFRKGFSGGFDAIVLIQQSTESEIWMFQDVFESRTFQTAAGHHLPQRPIDE